jgi:hypothetical protein
MMKCRMMLILFILESSRELACRSSECKPESVQSGAIEMIYCLTRRKNFKYDLRTKRCETSFHTNETVFANLFTMLSAYRMSRLRGGFDFWSAHRMAKVSADSDSEVTSLLLL